MIGVKSGISEKIKNIIFYIFVFVILVVLSQNYLLFHAYAEVFSIVIAAFMFIITWNARAFFDNRYLYFIGLSYLFVANMDFLHTLGYSGMNVFQDYDYHANQLWIVSRFIESGSFLIGFFLIKRKKWINTTFILIIYALISMVFILWILVFNSFPTCFVPGEGQTTFKIISELVIIAVLLLCLYLLRRNRSLFQKEVYHSLKISFILTIISEFFFTVYIDNYGISNLMGHFAKIVSFYLIYRAIIKMGIKEPYKVIFNNLNRKKRELERLNEEKIQLFSIVAHDLRNPFNGLINSARFLHEDYEKLGEAEKRDFLEMLYASSKKLYSITENLLEWSRINLSSTQLSPVKIDLDEILSEAIDYFTLMLNHKEISVRKENFEGCTVLADRGSLSIVFRNVLSNAIKFSYPNSVISINCLKLDDDIAIEFMDKGVGMSREKMEQLSGNLIKSSQGTSKEKGTGLGINIIKKHLELNEGEMEIFSKENIGTTVRIILKSGESI